MMVGVMLENKAAFVLIDPQRGFTDPEGTLGRTYGTAELAPIRETAARITQLVEHPLFAGRVHLVLACAHGIIASALDAQERVRKSLPSWPHAPVD